MNRSIVHIGYHKTATTWFQTEFYPCLTSHRYVDRAVARRALLDPHALQFDPDVARDVLGGGRIVVCEENLSGGLHNGGLAGCLSKDVATRIQRTLPDAQIVIFTRDQPSAIAAAYLQYVKGGGTHGLRRYLFGHERLGLNAPERDEAPRFRFEHFAYDRLVAHYDALFGRENVHLYAYEDFRADPLGFINSFIARHELEVKPADISFARSNPSLSRPLLWATRAANLFTRRAVTDKTCLLHLPGWYKLSRHALRRMSASARFGRALTARDLLDPQLTTEIRARYAASNAAIRARHPASQERNGFPAKGGQPQAQRTPLVSVLAGDRQHQPCELSADRKLDGPVKFDFDEARQRVARTDPSEVTELVELSANGARCVRPPNRETR